VLEEVQADLELSGHFSVVCSRSGRDLSSKLSSAGSSMAHALDASARLLKGLLCCVNLCSSLQC
jgi:hypothetical protein